MTVIDKAIIICGSTKCGTTSLYEYLSYNNSIVPSSRKETRFFLEKEVPLERRYFYEDGKSNYKKFFTAGNGENFFLEATPDYMYSKAALSRIKSDVQRPVLVFVLRDPVERFLSWYEYSKQKALIPSSMSLRDYIDGQDLIGEASTSQCYRALEQGVYQSYIDLWQREFLGAVCIIDFEELKSSGASHVLRGVLSKAGLESGSEVMANFAVRNKTFPVKSQSVQQAYEKFLLKGRRMFSHHHRLRKILRFINRKILKPALLKINTDHNYVASYSKEDVNWLKKFYDDKGVFRYLSGLRFDH